MSNTFKYLDDENKQSSNDDAAQEFLNEKLSKNKYTMQQQDTLDASGGSSVVTDPKTNKSTTETVTDKASLGGAGDLEARYAKAYGSSAGADLEGASTAQAANAVYDKIKALESDE